MSVLTDTNFVAIARRARSTALRAWIADFRGRSNPFHAVSAAQTVISTVCRGWRDEMHPFGKESLHEYNVETFRRAAPASVHAW